MLAWWSTQLYLELKLYILIYRLVSLSSFLRLLALYGYISAGRHTDWFKVCTIL